MRTRGAKAKTRLATVDGMVRCHGGIGNVQWNKGTLVPSMLRFSWNHPRRCVRLRGVVLIDEIGNHLTWLVRKRSVSPPNLAGSSQKPLQNMHVPFGALWCVEFSVVAEPRGILDSLHTHTHPPTHSLPGCLSGSRSIAKYCVLQPSPTSRSV